jgi:hypothetical protein
MSVKLVVIIINKILTSFWSPMDEPRSEIHPPWTIGANQTRYKVWFANLVVVRESLGCNSGKFTSVYDSRE